MNSTSASDFITDPSQGEFLPNTCVGNELTSPTSHSPTFLTTSHLPTVTSQTMQLGPLSNLTPQGHISLSPHSTFHLDLHSATSLNPSDQQQLPMLWLSATSLRPSQALQSILNLTSLTQEILPCRQISVDQNPGTSVPLVQEETSSNGDLVHVSATPNFASLRTVVSTNDSMHADPLCVDSQPAISANAVLPSSLLDTSQSEDITTNDIISQSGLQSCISNMEPLTNSHSIYSIAPSQAGANEITASVNSSHNNSCGLLDDALNHEHSGVHENSQCDLHTSVQDLNMSQMSLPSDLLSASVSNGPVSAMTLENINQHLEVEIVYKNSDHHVYNSSESIQLNAIENSLTVSASQNMAAKNCEMNEIKKCEATLSAYRNDKEEAMSLPHHEEEDDDDGNDTLKNFDGLVETVECFKCKLCPFISLSKKGVQNHVESEHASEAALHKFNDRYLEDHSDPEDKNNAMDDSNMNDCGDLENVNDDIDTDKIQDLLDKHENTLKVVLESTAKGDRFICSKCQEGHLTLDSCRIHMIEDHSLKIDKVRLGKLFLKDDSTNDGNKRISKRTRGRTKKETGSTTKENLCCERLLRTRRKQKLPRKMHSLTDSTSDDESEDEKHLKTCKKLAGTEISSSKESDTSLDLVQDCKNDLKLRGPSKKRGRPKGSKNTGITALKRKNPKLKVEEELGYRCEIDGCAIRLKCIDNLEYHRRCHIGDDSGFMCPECHEKFDHWRNISVHLWRNHVIDMELYACDQCSYKTYSFSKLVNMHKRIHSEERPFLCDTCGKGFKTSKQLRNHKVIHLDKRRQRSLRSGECDICHRFFSDKRMLRVHKDTVHNKLRPFLCNYCGYAASCRSTLKMHMRQHTGEKPFLCNLCAYRTADHNSLRRHKMRHSGEKPYKCPFCSYACIQSSTYKTHLKNKHPGQDEGLMYSCNLCAFRTIKKDNYITHMADHKAGTIPVKPEWTIQAVDNKHEIVSVTPDHTVLLQSPQSVTSLTQVDNMSGGLTAAQVMFSSIDDFRQKIAAAAQGYSLEMTSADRYPILGGLLKNSLLEGPVLPLDPTGHVEAHSNHQTFLVHEPLVDEVQQLTQSDSINHHTPTVEEH